ncbi:MAG TPA: hypothetical protein VNA27_16895 [Rubrobacteraceae bacterium]|nr:hypothetical protein [Rubrobacteraceae bacterium]
MREDYVMRETPERIEREMLEIRRRMSADVEDLRQHVESHVVAEQVRRSVGQRLRQAAERGKANLKAKQQDLADSAKSSLSLARWKISNGGGE